MDRPTKITFADMRAQDVRGLLIYCADYRCSHSIAISGDRWPDDLRLSDIKPRFIRGSCGQRATTLQWSRRSQHSSHSGFTSSAWHSVIRSLG
jgi:hypothetical protein